MKLGPSKLNRLLAWLAKPQSEVPESQVRMFNLTRQTMLAESLEIADRGERRRKGLLGREGLSPGEGLWIIPCEAVHTFGMRFPIDLVFLDRNYRVLKIRNEVRPGRLSVCLLARTVVELPSGTVYATQTAPGDTLTLLPNNA